MQSITMRCGLSLNLPLLLQGKNIEKVAGIDISSKAINLAKGKYGCISSLLPKGNVLVVLAEV